MKILVTGAAGFIGSHLAQKLLQQGETVIGLDNFNDYYDPAKKRANEKMLNQFDRFHMVEADLRDRQAMLELFEQEKFDTVAHLAALAGVRNAVKYPELYIAVDYNGSQHLMDGARFNGVQNFVFASTSSVYGNTQQIPFVETDSCDRPLQPYAAAKRGIEMLGFSYHHLFGLNFTATRFFTVYGPNGRPDMMAYLVADSIKYGKEIPIYNGGDMYRDWTFVNDITDGLVLALNKPLGYEVLNLGRGEPTHLKEFVRLIEKQAGGQANMVDTPMLSADVVRTYADISKAQTLLGYNPKISVDEGVRQFWDWYQQHG